MLISNNQSDPLPSYILGPTEAQSTSQLENKIQASTWIRVEHLFIIGPELAALIPAHISFKMPIQPHQF